MKKILEDIRFWVFIQIIIAIFIILLWVPPLVATLTYGDWTCAYRECIVMGGEDE